MTFWISASGRRHIVHGGAKSIREQEWPADAMEIRYRDGPAGLADATGIGSRAGAGENEQLVPDLYLGSGSAACSHCGR